MYAARDEALEPVCLH